ncbi:uncharacterized protein BDZ99DRAFT_24239 [Mytilinidion resinicola]|uniref:Uncharacterized protein n=1 Tax=Mytilinidion resinicola TaxID=574789 RepID=A0A6A6Z9U8_9PEZI|nr:uncharacterized protein BDZ99DRAFT_24239 [Mytilinidion resinicola]KAF2817810.1 hypothetical protein BDZ99DRAFT_24239 [Mytilinidion resinicola]
MPRTKQAARRRPPPKQAVRARPSGEHLDSDTTTEPETIHDEQFTPDIGWGALAHVSEEAPEIRYLIDEYFTEHMPNFTRAIPEDVVARLKRRGPDMTAYRELWRKEIDIVKKRRGWNGTRCTIFDSEDEGAAEVRLAKKRKSDNVDDYGTVESIELQEKRFQDAFAAGMKAGQQILVQSAVCENCEQIFDRAGKRTARECKSHPGSLKMNSYEKFWIDFLHRNPSCENFSPEKCGVSLDNYRWDCCNKKGKAAPCRTGSHIERVRKFKFVQPEWKGL